MKKTFKKCVSLLLCLVMTLGILSTGINSITADAATFSPRLTEPGYSGYYKPQSTLNPFKVNTSVGGGNCVWYAWGRAYEILGTRPNLLTKGNADVWWSNNISHGGYSYGQTAKLGAIACWYNSKGGHVAVVEKLNTDGTIVISQSGWSYKYYFDTETIKSNGTYPDAGTFQGFIYLGNYDSAVAKAPVTAQLSINKSEISIGETFTLSASSDVNCSYSFSIFDADSGEKVDYGVMNGSSYSNSFQKAGHYTAYISAFNNYGSIDSEWIDFYVYGKKPTKADLYADKEFVKLGESVVLKTTTDAFYVKIYISIFNANGNIVYSGNIPYSFSYTPENLGNYSCYVTAYTHEGGIDSNWVNFSVTNSLESTKPTSSSLSISKKELKIGETFELYASSDADCSYSFSIFDLDTGEKVDYGVMSGSSYSNSFQKAGHYTAYISAFNNYGSVDSEWIDFFVFGNKPTNAFLSIDKNSVELGESVRLTTQTDAYYVKIYISIFDSEDNIVYSGNIPYSFDFTPEKESTYYTYVSAYTHEGGVDSNWVMFTVGKYSVSYIGNGGTNIPTNQTKIYNLDLALSSTVPTRNGYTFLGWSKNSNATSVDYRAGDIYTENKDITLYAVWQKNSTPVINNISITIRNNPGTRTLNYGDTVRIHADAQNLPSGATIGWYVDDGSTISAKVSDDGTYCDITATGNGTVTLAAKAVDASGNVMTDSNGYQIADVQKINTKTSLWLRIVSFFKNLFGMNRTTVQLFKNMF